MDTGMDKGREIGVIGLGRSGVAAAQFLARTGHAVVACDDQPNPPLAESLREQPHIRLQLGGFTDGTLAGCHEILLSPGIPRAHPAIRAALARGAEVINDVEWLYRHAIRHGGAGVSFLGITGTNGKSTVTTLAGMMVAASGLNSRTGGNLGDAALGLWDPAVSWYVLELSSFQLESIDTFHAKVGVLLNVTPDHLDRYHELGAYLAAKKRLFLNRRPGDVAVINADDPVVLGPLMEELAKGTGQVIPFSLRRALAGGVYVQEGRLVDHRGAIPRILMDLRGMKMAGRHNQANAAAATAAALAAGANPDAVVHVLESFPGLPHRMEWVRELDGVNYYNDSKGTNVGAVVESLQTFPRGVVLIAGGRDKAGDFEPLARLLKGRVDGVVLMGEAAETMAQSFAGAARLSRAGSMNDAVAQARRLAQPGGVVLLSPACASFDMFKNFEDRGEKFREAVHGL